MTRTTAGRRARSGAQRRGGYVASIVVNGGLLFLINVAPGWSILPFLTTDFSSVLPWINASIMLSIVTAMIYLADDAPMVKGVGDLCTQAVGLVAMIKLWQVFPLDFGAGPNTWSTVFRLILIVAVVGTVIGMIVTAITALRAAHRPDDRPCTDARYAGPSIGRAADPKPPAQPST